MEAASDLTKVAHVCQRAWGSDLVKSMTGYSSVDVMQNMVPLLYFFEAILDTGQVSLRYWFSLLAECSSSLDAACAKSVCCALQMTLVCTGLGKWRVIILDPHLHDACLGDLAAALTHCRNLPSTDIALCALVMMMLFVGSCCKRQTLINVFMVREGCKGVRGNDVLLVCRRGLMEAPDALLNRRLSEYSVLSFPTGIPCYPSSALASLHSLVSVAKACERGWLAPQVSNMITK